MRKTLYVNGKIHPMTSETTEFSVMGVEGERICYLGNAVPQIDGRPDPSYTESIDLDGHHVYPTLTDSHVHLLYTIVLAAASFNLCEITAEGIQPRNFAGVAERIRQYCQEHPDQKIITGNQYILSAIVERRLPTRFELDEWTGGRAIILYNIDGHSSAMSTKLMEMLKLPLEDRDGIFAGAEHEFMQGKVTGLIASSVTPALLSKGIANFSNLCARYGISRVCAMDGNEDVKNDTLTKLLAFLSQRMDIEVRLFPQYMNYDRVQALGKKMQHLRAGGCGAWELDGSVGSHSAAFDVPYQDNGVQGHCYYPSEKIQAKVREALEAGIQLSSHAIGETAIGQIVEAYEKARELVPEKGPMPRIDHFEFPSRQAVEAVKDLRLAITVQPGFSWIDKRYLKSYEQFLPESKVRQQIPLKELSNADVCLCGSSDSPVQSMNPYDQMLGMVEYYLQGQSLTTYEALRTYTVNPARMLGEEADSGTLEMGKFADFFVASRDLLSCQPGELSGFAADYMVVKGRRYQEKRGTVRELADMLFQKKKKI